MKKNNINMKFLEEVRLQLAKLAGLQPSSAAVLMPKHINRVLLFLDFIREEFGAGMINSGSV